MPLPVTFWVTDGWPDFKSLDLALYSCDGSQDNPNGLNFAANRPILFEAYSLSPTLHSSSVGTQTSLAGSGSTAPGLIVFDSSGHFGQTQDQPATGYYQFLAAVKGSSGDGSTAGGWEILSHFAAIKPTSTQTSVSADLIPSTGSPVSGTRQPPVTGHDCCPFFLDLVSVGAEIIWSPAVTISDSSSATTTPAVNTTDSSGETCRWYAIWGTVSVGDTGIAIFDIGGSYPWTAPQGVFSTEVAAIGAGSGGGAGNTSTGGTEYGGGGGAGSEFAQGSVGVTPTDSYTVVVGAGGTGGTAPGSPAGSPGNGSGGGASEFAGDSTNVTAHGGSGGGGASGTADGTGGAGGTGSGASTHYNGGAGASGKTALYGGGGGSSAGTAHAGTTATSPNPAPAPDGGGPGGAGGATDIFVVQDASATVTGDNTLTVTMPGAISAGNTVLVFTYYQGHSPSSDPTVVLNDGTGFGQPAVTADDTSLSVPLQVGLYNAFNVPGGETSVTVTGQGSTNGIKVVMAWVYEVAGLGPSPGLDTSTSHTQGGAHPDSNYTSSSIATSDAPELWVGATGAQLGSAFYINDPDSNQNWNHTPKIFANNGGIYGGLLACSQVVTATGNMKLSGTFSTGVSKGTFAAAYTTSAATVGVAPVTGPGGGGGAGLGDSNGGGNGHDGQVTLTWTGPSGAGYGTPPVPAPYSGWSAATTVGAGAGNDVPINGVTGITEVCNFLANAPGFRIGGEVAESFPTGQLQEVTFSGVTPSLDNYFGWNSGTSTYTVQRSGLYLCHGLAAFAANSTGDRRAAFTVTPSSGSPASYWGPDYPACPAGTTNASKTQVLSLRAGDTIQLSCRQSSGASLDLDTGNQTRMFLVWLCEEGYPTSQWAPPDTTFRYASGTAGADLPGLFQQYLAGGLGFLVNRPYLLSYQTVAQSGLSAADFNTVTMDTIGSPIHTSDVGDSYFGWGDVVENAYNAPVDGWYLMAGEFFLAAPSVNNCTVIAGMLPTSSGGYVPSQTSGDWYQQLQAGNGLTGGAGATVFGLQWMSAGEAITPEVWGAGYSASYGTLTGTVQGAVYYSHLEMVWMAGA